MVALSGKSVLLTDRVKQPKIATIAAALSNGEKLLTTLCLSACMCVSVYMSECCEHAVVCMCERK